MKTKLKPCPFCGGEAILDDYGRYVYCPHTNAFKTPEDAIKDWNRRPNDANG